MRMWVLLTWIAGVMLHCGSLSQALEINSLGNFVGSIDSEPLKWGKNQTADCSRTKNDLKISIGDISEGRVEILIRNYLKHRDQSDFSIVPDANGEVRLLRPNSIDPELFQNYIYSDSQASCIVHLKRVETLEKAKYLQVWLDCHHLSQDREQSGYKTLTIPEANALFCKNAEDI